MAVPPRGPRPVGHVADTGFRLLVAAAIFTGLGAAFTAGFRGPATEPAAPIPTGPKASLPTGPTPTPLDGPSATTSADGHASPTGRPVASVPGWLDATGEVDVTADLQWFLDRVPDGTAVVFPAGARYRVDGTLWLVQRNGLRLEGNGATVFAGSVTDDSGRSLWRVRDSVGVTFQGFVIQGAHPRPGTYVEGFEWQHGIHIEGGARIDISDTTIERAFGDCLHIDGHDSGLADGVRFHDSVCRDNGRMGVAVTGGRDVVIERVTFTNMAYASIDLEPNRVASDQGAFDIVIRNNLQTGRPADGAGNVWLSLGGGGPVARVYAHDNLVESPWGLYIGSCCDPPRMADITITRSTATRGTRYGQGAPMYFQRVDRLTVTENVALAPQPCVKAVDSTDISVSSNTGCGPQT
jgi:hypothetical protein